MKITIAIPTYRRPEGIINALESVNKIQIPPKLSVNIIVVDNDSKASAKPIVQEFSWRSRFEVFYYVEPKRGLSNVRNRILNEAIALNADYLAGIDDDETVTRDWLVEMLIGINKYSADIVGSPVVGVFPSEAPDWAKNIDVYKSYDERRSGCIVTHIGAGNFLLDLKFILMHKLRFSSAFNFIGGEDSDFFIRCSQKGAKIVWIKEATIYESVSQERLKLKWIMKRNYQSGYAVALFSNKRSFVTFVRTFIKIIYSFPLSVILFLVSQRQQAVRYFFRFFFNVGKLSSLIGIKPYKAYKIDKPGRMALDHNIDRID